MTPPTDPMDPAWNASQPIYVQIRARIAAISNSFSRNFGISFNIAEFITWDPPSDNSYEHQYAALKEAI